ncbi:helix-turn-helix domain-containing protein [Streptomyces sp. NRRL F-5630]|uniref:helix-turn-helix domain-containing protein n=1 Tax=Streptomyces sp. NRRL F-5630 TaxID=1463864 RepID=UPI003EBC0730
MPELKNEPTPVSLRKIVAIFRRERGLSLQQVADGAKIDRSYVHRLENGDRASPGVRVVQALDDFYEADGLVVGAWLLEQEGLYRDRYARFKAAEARAVIQHKYTIGIPGLLQTERYARLAISTSPTFTDEEIDRRVANRVERQHILHRDPAPHVRIILDEVALSRRPTDSEVWREQIAFLVEAADHRAIVLQLLPLSAGLHDLMDGSLTILWADDGTSVAYVEGNKHGQLIDDQDEVSALRLSYDGVRDKALSPTATLEQLRQHLEESQ